MSKRSTSCTWKSEIIIILLTYLVIQWQLLCLDCEQYHNLGRYRLLSGLLTPYDFSKSFYVKSVILIVGTVLLIVIVKILHYVDVKVFLDQRKINISMIIQLGIVVACVCMCVVSLKGIMKEGILQYKNEKEIYRVQSLLREEKAVVHAGGNMVLADGEYAYTNSLEALESCYDSGNKVSEFDFMMTRDGRLVCAHDGGDGYWAYGFPFEKAPSEQEFLEEQFLGKFTSMCTSQLKVDTVSENYTYIFMHSTPYTVWESGSLKSMQDVLH